MPTTCVRLRSAYSVRLMSALSPARAPFFRAVGVRRGWECLRVERVQVVAARAVVCVVDELRSLRLGVHDERMFRASQRSVVGTTFVAVVRAALFALCRRSQRPQAAAAVRLLPATREVPDSLSQPGHVEVEPLRIPGGRPELTCPSAPKYACVPPVIPSEKWVPPNGTCPDASSRPPGEVEVRVAGRALDELVVAGEHRRPDRLRAICIGEELEAVEDVVAWERAIPFSFPPLPRITASSLSLNGLVLIPRSRSSAWFMNCTVAGTA